VNVGATGRGEPHRTPRRYVLALLLLAAFLVRLPGAQHGLWYDELHTVQQYLPLSWTGVMTSFTTPNNHIFYTLTLKAFDLILPPDLDRDTRVAAWRLWSIMVGTLAVAGVWSVARRALSDRAAIAAAAWFAVWPMAVDLSQQVRGYALVMCLGAASTACLLSLEKMTRRSTLAAVTVHAAYSALVVLMLYTHPLSIVVAVGHFVAVMARSSPRQRWSFVLTTLFIAVVTFRLYARVFAAGMAVASEYVPHQGGLGAIELFLSRTIRQIGARTGPAWIGAPVAAAAVCGAAAMLRRAPFAGLACVTPPLLLVAAGTVWPPLREPRYLPIVAPQLGLLIVAGALWAIDRAAARRRLLAVVLTASAAALCIPGLVSISRYPVQAIREAVVREHPDGFVVVVGLGAPESTFYQPRVVMAFSAQKLGRCLDTGLVKRVVVPYPRFWLEQAEQAELREVIAANFRQTGRYRGRLPEDPDVLEFVPR